MVSREAWNKFVLRYASHLSQRINIVIMEDLRVPSLCVLPTKSYPDFPDHEVYYHRFSLHKLMEAEPDVNAESGSVEHLVAMFDEYCEQRQAMQAGNKDITFYDRLGRFGRNAAFASDEFGGK